MCVACPWCESQNVQGDARGCEGCYGSGVMVVLIVIEHISSRGPGVFLPQFIQLIRLALARVQLVASQFCQVC